MPTIKLSASVLQALHTVEEALALYGLRCVHFDVLRENKRMDKKGDGVSYVILKGKTLDGKKIDAFVTVKKQASVHWKPVRVDFTVKPFGLMGVKAFTVNYMKGLDGDRGHFLADDLSLLRACALGRIAEIWEKFQGEMPKDVRIFGALDPAKVQVLEWQEGALGYETQHHLVVFSLPPIAGRSAGRIKVDCTGKNRHGLGEVLFDLQGYRAVFWWVPGKEWVKSDKSSLSIPFQN